MAFLISKRPYIVLVLLLAIGVAQFSSIKGIRLRGQAGGNPSVSMTVSETSLTSGMVRTFNIQFTTTDQATDVDYTQAAQTLSWQFAATATGAGTINKCSGHNASGGIYCNIGYLATGATAYVTVQARARGACGSWGNMSGTISDTSHIFMDYSPGTSIQTICPDFANIVTLSGSRTDFIRGEETSYDLTITNSGTGLVPYYSVRGALPLLDTVPNNFEFENVRYTSGSGTCTTAEYDPAELIYYSDTGQSVVDLAENHIAMEIGNNGYPVIAMAPGDGESESYIVFNFCYDNDCTSSGQTVITHEEDASTIPIGADMHMQISDTGPVILSTSHHNSTDEPFLLYCLDNTCSNYYKWRNPFGAEKANEHDFILKDDGNPLIVYQNIDPTTPEASNLHLTTVNCLTQSCATYEVTSHTTSIDEGSQPDIIMGSDGLPVIAHRIGQDYNVGGVEGLAISKCLTATCGSLRTSYYYPGHFPHSRGTQFAIKPSIVIGDDGFPIIAVNNAWTDISNEDLTSNDYEMLFIAKCLNHDCSSGIGAWELTDGFAYGRNPVMKMAPDGRPLILSFYEGKNNLLNVQVTKCKNKSCTWENYERVWKDISSVNPHPQASQDHMNGNFVINSDGLPVVVYPVTNTKLHVESCLDPACQLGGSPEIFVCSNPNTGLGAGSSAVIRATMSSFGLDCDTTWALSASGYPLANIGDSSGNNPHYAVDHNLVNNNAAMNNIDAYCYGGDLAVSIPNVPEGARRLETIEYPVSISSTGSFSTGVVISINNSDANPFDILGGYTTSGASCNRFTNGNGLGERVSCYIGFVGSGTDTATATFSINMHEDIPCNTNNVIHGSGSSGADDHTLNINGNNLIKKDNPGTTGDIFVISCQDNSITASSEECPLGNNDTLVTTHTITASGGSIPFGVYEQTMTPNIRYQTGSFASGSGTCTTGSLVETVITRFSDIGAETTLTIPPDNLPVITTIGNDNLKAIKCRDPYCEHQDSFDQYDIITNLPGADLSVHSAGFGTQSQSVLGADGNPILAYAFQEAMVLVNCSNKDCSSSSYNKIIIGSRTPTDASITLGTNGFPTLTWHSNSLYLNVLNCHDNTCDTYDHNIWRTADADTASEFSGAFSDVEIGYDGNPIIAAMRGIDDPSGPTAYYSLELIKCHDPSCNTITDYEFKNKLEQIEYFPSIAINQTNNPIIVHHNGDKDLYSLYCVTASCTVTTSARLVESAADNYGGIMEVVVPPDNLPVIFVQSDGSEQGTDVYKCLNPSCSFVTDQTRNTNRLHPGDDQPTIKAAIHPKDHLPFMINETNQQGGNNMIVVKCIDPSCEYKYHTGSVLCTRTDTLPISETDTLNISYDITGYDNDQEFASVMTGWIMTGIHEINGTEYGTELKTTFTQPICSQVDISVGIQGQALRYRGEKIEYAATIINSGLAAASGFVLTSTLPPTSKFIGYGVEGGSSRECVGSGETVICTVAEELGAGETKALGINAFFQSQSRDYCNQYITHTGSVALTSGTESDDSNNTTTYSTLIECVCGDGILDNGEECDVQGTACTPNGEYCAQCIDCSIFRSGGGRGGSRTAGGEVRPPPPPRPDDLQPLASAPEAPILTGSCCVGKNLQAGRCEEGSLYGIDLNRESCESPTFQGKWYSDPDGMRSCLQSDCEVIESPGACCMQVGDSPSCERSQSLSNQGCRASGGIWFEGSQGMLACMDSGCVPEEKSCFEKAELFSSIVRLGGISCPDLVLSTRYFGNGEGEIRSLEVQPKPSRLLSTPENFLPSEPRGSVGTFALSFEPSQVAASWLRTTQLDGNGGVVVSKIKDGSSEKRLSANPDRAVCECGTAVSIDFNELAVCEEGRGYQTAMITVSGVNPESKTTGLVVELQAPSDGNARMDVCSLRVGSIRPKNYKLFDFPCGRRITSTQTGGKPRIVFEDPYASFVMNVSRDLLKDQVKVTAVFEDGTMAGPYEKTCKGVAETVRAVRSTDTSEAESPATSTTTQPNGKPEMESGHDEEAVAPASRQEVEDVEEVEELEEEDGDEVEPKSKQRKPSGSLKPQTPGKLFLVLPPKSKAQVTEDSGPRKPFLLLPSLLQFFITR